MASFALEKSSAYQSLLSLGRSADSVDLAALLRDRSRCDRLIKAIEGVTLDLSRQLVDIPTLEKLLALAREAGLESKIADFFGGVAINGTEGRAVLHMALRANRDEKFTVDGVNVTQDVYATLDSIRAFADGVRSGKIRFLANVDPAGFRIAVDGLDANRTMAIVISKTFTTAETLRNAGMVRAWLKENIHDPSKFAKHMCAVSTNLKLTKEFGMKDSQVFGFWDWVGGRFSVSSAVGILPLAIHFGFDVVEKFLAGARFMDEHFRSTPLEDNMPVLMALCSFYNASVLGLNCVALLPYSEDLSLFPRYVQQLCMESNGKSVRMDGARLSFDAGEIYFGESGTNGQHSFYQLLHQGRVVPSEFIGYIRSDNGDRVDGGVTSHQELMANFFAQPDALAYGRTPAQLEAAGCPANLIQHKLCPGNRPSMVMLFDEASPFALGALVALYEHRVAVQGFLWGINSFDQMGVELGKALAGDIRNLFKSGHHDWPSAVKEGQISYSTTRLLAKFAQ
uniref:Glucose-6-phosphate isomerase n=1 Tax=Babesia bovis TaxID=5865 RepID=S6AZ61_BABBO|nr:glucose-6-phosphate isomerase protein [Babesia bovis]